MSEHRWYDLGDGRSVYRKAIEGKHPGKSDVFKPLSFISDSLDAPAYSGADGNQYTSKAALRNSYKASNNPRGVDFVEVGNEKMPEPQRRQPSDAAIEQSIMKAFDASE